MTVGHQSVLHTRDAKHFRRINTPIGPLAHHFFTLLSNPGIDGAKMRQAFAPALSGHRLPPGHELDPTLEPRLRQLLTMVSTDHSADHGSTSTGPPQVCLLQGALRPDHLLEPPTTPPGSASSDAGSVFSHMSTTPSMGSATQVTPDLSEVILVPYMLHQQLIEATQDRDNDRKVIVSMMILATLTHETAHWLYTKVRCLLEYLGPILPSALLKGCQQCHGFKMDPERKATDDPSSLSRHHISHTRPDDFLIVLGQRPTDVGLLATHAMFGYYFKMLTWADGDQQLIKKRIDGVPVTAKPAVSAVILTHLLSGPLPAIKDATGAPHSLVGTRPPWAEGEDTFLITAQLGPNTICHHGLIRLS